MERGQRHLRFLDPADEYLKNLPDSEQAMIDADTETMRLGEESHVKTKQLRGPIRELVAGNHRITYFTLGTTIYFVRGFRKKSTKTPRDEIEYAEKIYKSLKQAHP